MIKKLQIGLLIKQNVYFFWSVYKTIEQGVKLSQNKLIKLVWSVSCRAHLKSIFSISRVLFFKKTDVFSQFPCFENNNKFHLDSWSFGANFLKIKSRTINLTIFRKILIIFKILFSEFFFSSLWRAWNCDHFFLLQFFSNSAQLAVRAFCPKWTPLTSALVKVIDVAGLKFKYSYMLRYDLRNQLEMFFFSKIW